MVHPESRADRLAGALDEFIRSSPDVEASAVVSFDGLTMASALPDDLEEDRLGAMSAALLSLGEQAAMGLGRGQLNQVFVEGEHGFVFLMSAQDQAVLAAIARRTAKIGLMLYEMRRAADRIGTILAPEEDDAARTLAELGGLHDTPEPAGRAPADPAPWEHSGASAAPEPARWEAQGSAGGPDAPSPAPAPEPPAEPGGWSVDEPASPYAPHLDNGSGDRVPGALWSS